MAVEPQDKNKRGVKRKWTAGRKKEAVLRLLRGDPIDNLSRELGVTMAQLEEWKEIVLTRMELLLKDRTDEPLHAELETAKKRIGEICMENELLREQIRKKGVFWGGKW